MDDRIITIHEELEAVMMAYNMDAWEFLAATLAVFTNNGGTLEEAAGSVRLIMERRDHEIHND